MKVLLIGGGGREHALAWKISRSHHCKDLICAPGNPGMAGEKKARCVAVPTDDIPGIVKLAEKEKPDLVIVGPEAPLVAGLADRLREFGFTVFGPSAAAAQLEGSKTFFKELCKRKGIPTAPFGTFASVKDAEHFIREHGAPLVVKADGLAAGKGVVIANTTDEALAAAREMLSGEAFGDAGRRIVVEQFLEGPELSYFAITDGQTLLPLAAARDHKKIGEGDTGPNTGGMGAYSPVPGLDEALETDIIERILKPTVEAMAENGTPFSGVLYAGLILTKDGPMLLEYNVRFGDPECQVLMMRLETDILMLLRDAAKGWLSRWRDRVNWLGDSAVCVVVASEGYPGEYDKGEIIGGASNDLISPVAVVFHAGTARDEYGHLVSAGGRVLGVTARGENLREARDNAYGRIAQIEWPGRYFRRDIAATAVSEAAKPEFLDPEA